MSPSHWTTDDLPEITGRTIVITGATSGIGLESTRALAAAGARVVLAVRDPTTGEAVAATVRGTTEVRRLDLSDLSSVNEFARLWDGRLDVLINNAGIMTPPEGRSADGFELQMATNHLGPFLLTTLLLPQITDRVVSVSSQLHARARLDPADLAGTAAPYNAMRAYANSKLAGILVTLELQRRLTEAGSPVRALVAHPGIARTNLSRRAGGFAAVFDRVLGRLFNDAATGALPIEYAATMDVPGGSYVGPGGLGHLRGYPMVHQPSSQARDSQLAERVWDASVQLTGAVVRCRAGALPGYRPPT
jgi:NAD(P)-dependent dehydrogenase (short-subunit alcohol dehydrogenase family)